MPSEPDELLAMLDRIDGLANHPDVDDCNSPISDAFHDVLDPATVKTITAAARRSVVPRWQPIETAPKDVNWVLLFIPGHVPPVAQATWDAGSWWVFGDSIAPKPTHWMKLPEPPNGND